MEDYLFHYLLWFFIIYYEWNVIDEDDTVTYDIINSAPCPMRDSTLFGREHYLAYTVVLIKREIKLLTWLCLIRDSALIRINIIIH